MRADNPTLSDWSRQVGVLTFSRIARDRRVLRQCALLEDMSHQPLVIAYREPEDALPYASCLWPVPRPTLLHRLSTVARQLPAHLGLWAAKAGFWIEPRHRWALAALTRHAPRLVIANDWPALVVAAAYKQASGCLIHYDTHEFATLEFDERAFWRLVYKPMVTALERDAIPMADSISTVGPRLAEALQEHYALARPPAVVRNIPDRIALDANAQTGWPLRLLFHGNIVANRGLEALIDSLEQWTTPHFLTIRGNGAKAYVDTLRQRVRNVRRSDFVRFEPAVHPDEVIPLAAETADCGVFFTPLDTLQQQFTMPNKLFEYISAGLAVAVSPAADMRDLVLGHDLGLVSENDGAEAIAATINSLTRESVDQFKAKARVAAQSLCWDAEKMVLKDALERLTSKTELP